ncbi:hypothetical protein M3Y97_00477200 [Aphelenchoides bicaudatus]|nr:hypothetical protein M3Y97_00477200 [Aphelenchoides bicaudatus]
MSDSKDLDKKGLEEKTTKEHKQCETQSSTATSESSQIEDVEIINAEDEEETDEHNSQDEQDDQEDSESTKLEEKPLVETEISELDDPKAIAELANSIADLSEDQKDELFTEEQRQSSIQNLILCSAILFTVPLSLMYCSYRFVFQDVYHMSSADASLYGGIVGVAAVYVIIALYIYSAYNEEKGLETRYKEIKKNK